MTQRFIKAPLTPHEIFLSLLDQFRRSSDVSPDQEIVHVIESVFLRHANELMRRLQSFLLPARSAVTARFAGFPAAASASRAHPLSRSHGEIDIFSVSVPQTHSAKLHRQIQLQALLSRTSHVLLHRLLSAPVARHAAFAIVHATPDRICRRLPRVRRRRRRRRLPPSRGRRFLLRRRLREQNLTQLRVIHALDLPRRPASLRLRHVHLLALAPLRRKRQNDKQKMRRRRRKDPNAETSGGDRAQLELRSRRKTNTRAPYSRSPSSRTKETTARTRPRARLLRVFACCSRSVACARARTPSGDDATAIPLKNIFFLLAGMHEANALLLSVCKSSLRVCLKRLSFSTSTDKVLLDFVRTLLSVFFETGGRIGGGCLV